MECSITAQMAKNTNPPNGIRCKPHSHGRTNECVRSEGRNEGRLMEMIANSNHNVVLEMTLAVDGPRHVCPGLGPCAADVVGVCYVVPRLVDVQRE
jgi:hypothetical protein